MARDGWSFTAPRNLRIHGGDENIRISRITAVNSRHAQVVPESRDGKNGNCQKVAADQRGPHNLGDGLVTVF